MWNSAEILVLGPHLCIRILVHATIDLLKSHCQKPIIVERNSKCISSNLLSLLEAQNKDIGAASQMLLTGVRLPFPH